VALSVSVPAVAADRTATWTLNCGKNGCGANWSWYQNGTLISYGYSFGSSGTTIQPSAADSIRIELSSGTCIRYGGGSFTPGSAIKFTVKLTNQSCSNPYQQANATFSISS
jgi:hypothetical protein